MESNGQREQQEQDLKAGTARKLVKGGIYRVVRM